MSRIRAIDDTLAIEYTCGSPKLSIADLDLNRRRWQSDSVAQPVALAEAAAVSRRRRGSAPSSSD